MNHFGARHAVNVAAIAARAVRRVAPLEAGGGEPGPDEEDRETGRWCRVVAPVFASCGPGGVVGPGAGAVTGAATVVAGAATVVVGTAAVTVIVPCMAA